MSYDPTQLLVGHCKRCGGAVTEADNWGPAVDELDTYPPVKVAVFHWRCELRVRRAAYLDKLEKTNPEEAAEIRRLDAAVESEEAAMAARKAER